MNSIATHQLAELCAARGIQHVILCPGSRSAPLTLAFLRNNQFTCWTFSDERSAAFIALGMARQTGRPVVLICTSGSAGYNFAPAVAEAYFQHVPLIVITADRPKEWIDQLDGQTIRQIGLYGNHVKRFFELPQDYSHHDAVWHSNRIVNEAVNLSISEPAGPIHINAPFREPLYPSGQEKKAGSDAVRKMEVSQPTPTLSEDQWSGLLKTISGFKKILVVPGQQAPSPKLQEVVDKFHTRHRWPFAGDILSNFHACPFYCRHTDAFLGQMPEPLKSSLKPDLLISFGNSLVTKNLKLFLRKNTMREHWHIHPTYEAADTFQSLTRIIPVQPDYFFEQLNHRLTDHQITRHAYADEWLQHEIKARNEIDSFFQKHDQGEFSFLKKVMNALPDSCNLHLANSMSVRYANHIGLSSEQKGVNVFCNRGTSGIDGCTSTAVGQALTSNIPNILITGDQAFFYDRNAFWHNYPISNLFVVVLNNHGGIIFNMIDGPSGLPEAEEFFVTRQALRAKPLAQEFGLNYSEGATVSLKDFFKPDGNAKILELESSQSTNTSIFEAFKKQIKKSYEA